MIETFHNFQLSVTEGQRTLGRQVEAAKKRKEAAAMEVAIIEAAKCMDSILLELLEAIFH